MNTLLINHLLVVEARNSKFLFYADLSPTGILTSCSAEYILRNTIITAKTYSVGNITIVVIVFISEN